MRWPRSLPLLAASCLALATPLWSDGVAVHNGSSVAWRIQRNRAYGEGRYFAYLEAPEEAASRGLPWEETPDWMDIDFPTTGFRPEITLEPGQTLRIDLIGNGTLQEGFTLQDSAGHRSGSFVVSRPAPKAGRPQATDLFFVARSRSAYRFEWNERLLRILEPVGSGLEGRGSGSLTLGGAGSAFGPVAGRAARTLETKEERKEARSPE